MKVKVTVGLKTGMKLVFIIFDKAVQSIKERYSKIINDKKALVVDDGKIIQIIPTDSIAFVEIEEVTE